MDIEGAEYRVLDSLNKTNNLYQDGAFDVLTIEWHGHHRRKLPWEWAQSFSPEEGELRDSYTKLATQPFHTKGCVPTKLSNLDCESYVTDGKPFSCESRAASEQ